MTTRRLAQHAHVVFIHAGGEVRRREMLLGGVAMGVGSAAKASGLSDDKTVLPHKAGALSKVIFQEADGEHLVRRAGPMGGLPFTIKLDDKVGGSSNLFVFTEVLAPGQMIPWHRHDTSEEVMLIEEGGVTITIGAERVETGRRAMAFMPQGVWHSAINTGSIPVHVTALYSNKDFDVYMRAISVPSGSPIIPINPAELPRLRALGHATYWDNRAGPFPPGVARP